MKNKKFIFISILILAIGFAAVSTTLYITGNIAYQTNKEDFNVYFSEAIVDGEDKSNELIIDKTHIRYITNELKTIGDTSVLEFEVTNESKEYDVDAKITCAPKVATDIVSLTVDTLTFSITSGGIHKGTVTSELLKVQTESKDIEFECEIEVKATERTSRGSSIAELNSYAISGTLKDEYGNILPNTDLVVYSNTPHEVTTDNNGYFYVENLEKGIHEIYLKSEGVDVTNKEEVKVNSSFGATLTTNNVYKVIKGNFKLDNTQAGTKIEDNTVRCEYEPGKTWEFNYNGTTGSDGSKQEFIVPCDGTYKLETWGAQGGNVNSNKRGGYGAYSVGNKELTNREKLFIYVGGQGETCTLCNLAPGGYNGGGNGFESDFREGTTFSGGGGATHIATISGILADLENDKEKIYLVSGGGAGNWEYPIYNSYYYSIDFGDAGGISSKNTRGYNSDYNRYNTVVGATQTSGNAFGLGGTHNYQSAGGGGGWYGGVSGQYNATGGSSYIGNSLLTNKSMYCYNCTSSSEESTKTISTTCTSATPTENCAKQGNGYARITLISID